MLEFYQNIPRLLDPIAFAIGSFSVRWYSISYLTGFLFFFLLLMYRIKRRENSEFFIFFKDIGNIIDFFIFSIAGILIGGRIGYVFFYKPNDFFADPLMIINPFSSSGEFVGIYGMSFFGALLGVIFSGIVFSEIKKINFLELADFVVPMIPLAYFWGRLGNFINGELYGRPTEFFFGMHFSSDKIMTLRHPSQLYEAFFEGIVLFALLWIMRNKKFQKGALLFLYIAIYSLMRFIIEFFRQPDKDVYSWHLFTLGQLLSILSFCLSFAVFIYIKKYVKISSK